jgi:hypothetical protein
MPRNSTYDEFVKAQAMKDTYGGSMQGMAQKPNRNSM